MKNNLYTILIFFSMLTIQLPALVAQNHFAGRTHEFLAATRDSFPNVAGIDVVVVKEQNVLFTASAGYADVAARRPFTPETGLYIASNTKSFTGLALQQLIRNGSISLDDPVTTYLNRAWFPDSTDVSGICIRDLLAHTHGLSNNAMTFRTAFAGNAPDSLLPGLLQFTSWREGHPSQAFSYSNFSYLHAGMVIREVTGVSWRDYVKDSLLIPAGFYHTSPYVSDFKNDELAAPYIYSLPGKAIEPKHDNTMHAAGGIISTMEDMSRWLRLFLNKGRIGHQQVLPAGLIHAAMKPLVADTGTMGPFNRFGYASGWIAGAYHNEPMYFHFGSYTGYGSMMSVMPERKLGIFVFTNEGSAGMYLSALVTTFIYDLILDKENADKTTRMITGLLKNSYRKKAADTTGPVSALDFPLHQPTTFISRPYGKLVVRPDHEHVSVKLGNLHSLLYPGDSIHEYIVRWIPGDPEKLILKKTSRGYSILYEDYTVFEAQ